MADLNASSITVCGVDSWKHTNTSRLIDRERHRLKYTRFSSLQNLPDIQCTCPAKVKLKVYTFMTAFSIQIEVLRGMLVVLTNAA